MMMQTLKQRLQSMKDFNHVSQQAALTLSEQMLEHIGSPDPILRDELIYRGLATWIMDEKFDQTLLRSFYDQALNEDHLFHKIGNVGDDSVFKRSFSVLLLPPLIEVHKQEPFLSREGLLYGLQAVTTYLKQERDVRGHVPQKGWAHSVAHAADAIESFASCTDIEGQDLLPVFDAIKTAISLPSPYHYAEDERLITALETIMPKVDDGFINEWIQSFKTILLRVGGPKDDIIHFNIKTFLRSLYFRLLWKGEDRYREAVLATLEPIEEMGAY